MREDLEFKTENSTLKLNRGLIEMFENLDWNALPRWTDRYEHNFRKDNNYFPISGLFNIHQWRGSALKRIFKYRFPAKQIPEAFSIGYSKNYYLIGINKLDTFYCNFHNKTPDSIFSLYTLSYIGGYSTSMLRIINNCPREEEHAYTQYQWQADKHLSSILHVPAYETLVDFAISNVHQNVCFFNEFLCEYYKETRSEQINLQPIKL